MEQYVFFNDLHKQVEWNFPQKFRSIEYGALLVLHLKFP